MMFFIFIINFFFASASKFKGQGALFLGKNNPFFRCLFPDFLNKSLQNCKDDGVLNVVPGLLGLIQANEVIKWILQLKSFLVSQFLEIDLLTTEFKVFHRGQNPNCKTCILQEDFHTLHNNKQREFLDAKISFYELKQKLASKEKLNLIDVRTIEEHQQFDLLNEICIPLSELVTHSMPLNLEYLTVVYCQSGLRSQQAVSFLKQKNINAVYLDGGIIALNFI